MNYGNIIGTVIEPVKVLDESEDTKIYVAEISVKRRRRGADVIKVHLPERAFDPKEDYFGRRVYITGELRSRRRRSPDGQYHWATYFFADHMAMTDSTEDLNQMILTGNIYTDPTQRTRTVRERTNTNTFMILNVLKGRNNRERLPIVCGGGLAAFASSCNEGDFIELRGQIRTRGDIRRSENGKMEVREFTEVMSERFTLVRSDKEKTKEAAPVEDVQTESE